MPGVPSGRGCDGCRKQKKKCNQGRPRCSRCERLDLPCIGAGVQRFKFKSHNELQIASTRRNSNSPISSSASTETIDFTPTSTIAPDRLLGELVHIISLSTSLKYNFIYAYGGFLMRVPQHLGINEALDASTEAVIYAYTDFCRGSQRIAPRTLMLYTRALAALRLCLNDSGKACASETLCAVMILMVCQNFIGTQGNRWTTHCEGTAQILRARGKRPPRCPMEAELLVCLRAPVVFEALFNERIRMTRLEWEVLIQSELDDGTLEGQMMHCLSYVPGFIRRGRNVLRYGFYDPTLLTEVDIQYHRMKEVLAGMKLRMLSVEIPAADKVIDMTGQAFLYALFQRGYGLGLFVATILNCILMALGANISELSMEAATWADEVLDIARQAQIYRPLGAGWVIISLLAAFAGATDPRTRSQVIALIEDYHHDFQWSIEAKVFEDLKSVTGRILICEPDVPSLPAMQTWEDLFSVGCTA